jgi:hypothetical protein
MRRRGTIFRIVVAVLTLLATATAQSAVRPTISEPLAAKPQGWVLLVAGVIVVGLIAWRRFGAGDFTDD